MQKLLKKDDINHYPTYSVRNANGQTIQPKNDMFTLNENYRWIDLMQLRVQHVKASKYRYATCRRNSRDRRQQYSRIKITAPAQFKVGDSVCVSKFKTLFEKDYMPNWTMELFKIIEAEN